MISAWNANRITHRGVPNLQGQRMGTNVIHPSEVPTGTEASAMHRGQGGRLTDPHSLGTDPLDGNDALKEQRELNYSCTVNKTYAEIFHELLIGNKQPFEQATLQYIALTHLFA